MSVDSGSSVESRDDIVILSPISDDEEKDRKMAAVETVPTKPTKPMKTKKLTADELYSATVEYLRTDDTNDLDGDRGKEVVQKLNEMNKKRDDEVPPKLYTEGVFDSITKFAGEVLFVAEMKAGLVAMGEISIAIVDMLVYCGLPIVGNQVELTRSMQKMYGKCPG
jgi:hypothetical protein